MTGKMLTCGTIRCDRSSTDDSAASTLFDHLLCSCDMSVHQTQQVNSNFVFYESDNILEAIRYEGSIGY